MVLMYEYRRQLKQLQTNEESGGTEVRVLRRVDLATLGLLAHSVISILATVSKRDLRTGAIVLAW